MRKVIFTLIGILLTFFSFSQTTLLQEGFEGSTIALTSSSASGTKNWATTTTFASQGLKSDTAAVAASDTLFLTSGTLNCTNMSFVQLEFDQIAKLEYFDAAYV